MRVEGSPPRWGDDGVSPVIGMVLILAISVLGIVAVTNWGLPAIMAMQQNVEQRSVLNEFGALDASMQKLIAGTTGQTTFKWQPSIGKGAVDVNPTGERWLIAVDVTTALTSEWEGVSDADNAFVLRLTGTLPAGPNKLHVYRWVEGVATEVQAVTASNSCTAWSPPAGAGGNTPLWLKTNATSGCAAVNLDNAVLSFSLRSEPAGGKVAILNEAYLADVGRVHWSSVLGTLSHIYHSNGAIFSGGGNASLVPQSPLAVSPLRTFKNSTGQDSEGLFLRLLKLNGTASFSGVEGGARTSVFLDFSGTWTMGSIDDADRVSVYVFGQTREGVYRVLQDGVAGYPFAPFTTAGAGDPYERYTQSSIPLRVAVAFTFVEVQR